MMNPTLLYNPHSEPDMATKLADAYNSPNDKLLIPCCPLLPGIKHLWSYFAWIQGCPPYHWKLFLHLLSSKSGAILHVYLHVTSTSCPEP